MSLAALTECVVVLLRTADLEEVIAVDPVFGARLALDLLGGVSERFGRHLQHWRRNQQAGPTTSKFRRDFHQLMRPGSGPALARAPEL
jgi:hypothetical protein